MSTSALAAGRSPQAIREALAEAGWNEPQIARALGSWAPGEDGLPVPRPPVQLSARDAFLHLVLFAALYASAWQLGSLVFDLIELALPDPAGRPDAQFWRHDSIRFSVAALLVAFPLFLGMTVKIDREIAADPLRRESPVRQWLGYLTLFGAILVLTGSAVSMIYGLLRGELTVQFLLKVATVAAIGSACNCSRAAPRRAGRRTGANDGALAGPPRRRGGARGRIRRPAADRRSRDRQVAAAGRAAARRPARLAGRIEDYRRLERRLPADLAALDRVAPGGIPVGDPATGEPYGYEPLGGGLYRVCARLALPDPAGRRRDP